MSRILPTGTMSPLPILVLLLSQLLILSSSIPTVSGLVQGSSSRQFSNALGELLVETMSVTASRTIPFPLPLPGRRTLRDNHVKDLHDNRRKMVSLFAMGLTELLVAQQQQASTALAQTDERRSLAPAAAAAVSSSSKKLYNLSNEDLAAIIKQDCREKQFLYTADMTKAIYDDAATFKDGSGIDGSYPMEAWIRGCNLLFDAGQSQCKILEHTMSVTNQQVWFRFTETLTFRTMWQPRVYLTGTVVMKRDPQTGLIMSYEEQWDQDMNEIFRRTQFTL